MYSRNRRLYIASLSSRNVRGDEIGGFGDGIGGKESDVMRSI